MSARVPVLLTSILILLACAVPAQGRPASPSNRTWIYGSGTAGIYGTAGAINSGAVWWW